MKRTLSTHFFSNFFHQEKIRTDFLAFFKLLSVLITVFVGLFYSLPNFYETLPAVQISSVKSDIKISNLFLSKIQNSLLHERIEFKEIFLEKEGSGNCLKLLFSESEMQIKAYKFLEDRINRLGKNYIIAFCSTPNYPNWMKSLGRMKPKPLFLGLDLQGGISFLLKVDMNSVIRGQYNAIEQDISAFFYEKEVSYENMKHDKSGVVITFKSEEERDHSIKKLVFSFPHLIFEKCDSPNKFEIVAMLSQSESDAIKIEALQQNIVILDRRIGELGISEPVLQQQGRDSISIQLPGTLDITGAKKVLSRSTTLEMRLVEELIDSNCSKNGFDSGIEIYKQSYGNPLFVRKQTVLTGKNIRDARTSIDPKNQQVSVNLILDEQGKQVFRKITKENIGKQIAILLFDDGKSEVITAPVIRSEISGGRVQILGSMSIQEANELALILRSGSLSAPVKIVQEKTIKPSLGSDNIKGGIQSTYYGILLISFFMIVYYRLFGLFSIIGLFINAILLVTLLSIFQITLTLPGIAAVALTLGIAIDSNVLINERIREELRNGSEADIAIYNGFKHAWNTIIDSNLMAFIVGLGLLTFGSGPIRGFAIVHCFGILTSLCSSFFIVRTMINSWYSKQRILKISI